MIRVVLDTNIVVSASLKAEGLFCVATGCRYRRRRWRQPFARIRDKGLLVTVTIPVPADACQNDPDYTILLECAEAVEAEYLVTGNRKHYPDQWQRTRIVTAREFLEIITGMEPPASYGLHHHSS